ncbi:HpcH/HpaI aldolase family protein [Metabacillus sp. Hm71]|uniref:HpcH/HpaI aldolase family protein n=1 Tax=Metabacillus sp. Hm71 TaxID=3450743 RepID=UPI003F433433
MKNSVKDKLKRGEQVLGAFLGIYSPPLVEMLGYAGFDYVLIDDEHGAFSSSELENMIRTADSVGLASIVRVSYDPSSIQKALDRGANAIQVPMVNTKEDALEVVKRAKFSPHGNRGVSYSIRPARYGKDSGKSYLDECNENIMIIVHIETPEAVNNFEEIVSVDGIDLAFIGSTDLSVSMGYQLEGANHPEVQKVINDLYKKGEILNVPIGTVAGNGGTAVNAFEKGAQLVCIVLNNVITSALNEVVSASRPFQPYK